MDPSVLAVLELAVAEDPHNPALRVHLASLLVMTGEAGRALEHAQAALAVAPDDVEALATARDSARALGERARADRYDRILARSLPWSDMPPPREEPIPGFALPKGFTEFEPDTFAEPERPRVTLADVAGMEPVKARIEVVVRTRPRSGVLLYGPPGCGKTFLARAVAGELGASFIALALDDVQDGFEAARRAAPCVLLLHALDVVDELRAELDAGNEGVIVLAATDRPWDVDPALRGPGRLDRSVLVPGPDAPAREAILRRALDQHPIDGADPAALARGTEGCSGADLRHIVESARTRTAVERAARDAPRSAQAWIGVARHYEHP